MTSQLNNLGSTLPPVGTVAVVPGSATGITGGGDAPQVPSATPAAPAAGSPEAVRLATLQQLVALLGQLMALVSAQSGVASVSGGGAVGIGVDTSAMSGSDALAAVSGGTFGGSTRGWEVMEPTTAPAAGSFAVTGGGGTGRGWNVVEPTAIPVSGSVTGGGAAAPSATPQFDSRRLLGTPQPGGAIDLAIRSASPTAAPAKSEGTWLTLTDANGAQLQAHVHGAFASQPARIAEGIQRGLIAVHLHPDGVIHMHDVA